MDIYICTEADGYIVGAADSLEGAKALIGGDTSAIIAWRDWMHGSECTIDRRNGWGPQHYASIHRHELNSSTENLEPA